MWPSILLAIYCVLIALSSLSGGFIAARLKLTHARMQFVLSFVSGLMLGVGLLHLVPHAALLLPSVDQVVLATLAGLLVMFFLLRIFSFHDHGHAEADGQGDEHHHNHHHSHGDHRHANAAKTGKGWAGLAAGLALHTMLDGVALASSLAIEIHGDNSVRLLGFGTFLAIALHKPLDMMSILTLMKRSGARNSRRLMVNLLFSLACPIGAVLFWFGIAQFTSIQTLLVGFALAFSAGVFLCISLGDLLPEIQFHSHDRVGLSVALLLGVGVAYVIGLLPGHSHQAKDWQLRVPVEQHEINENLDSLPPSHLNQPQGDES